MSLYMQVAFIGQLPQVAELFLGVWRNNDPRRCNAKNPERAEIRCTARAVKVGSRGPTLPDAGGTQLWRQGRKQ
jgi:hypothetical protein